MSQPKSIEPLLLYGIALLEHLPEDIVVNWSASVGLVTYTREDIFDRAVRAFDLVTKIRGDPADYGWLARALFKREAEGYTRASDSQLGMAAKVLFKGSDRIVLDKKELCHYVTDPILEEMYRETPGSFSDIANLAVKSLDFNKQRIKNNQGQVSLITRLDKLQIERDAHLSTLEIDLHPSDPYFVAQAYHKLSKAYGPGQEPEQRRALEHALTYAKQSTNSQDPEDFLFAAKIALSYGKKTNATDPLEQGMQLCTQGMQLDSYQPKADDYNLLAQCKIELAAQALIPIGDKQQLLLSAKEDLVLAEKYGMADHDLRKTISDELPWL